jgi:hypothetical protein
MGNFKHQSLRANDRDRDLDKDKEGQEKLRNVCFRPLNLSQIDWSSFQLSDKYDRDRLALPSTLSGFRNKEREVAPHLAGGSSSRTQTQLAPVASRRAETRDAKKKAGESSEDWRRGMPSSPSL